MEKGITFLEIGILYSTREIVIMIMEIPSGVISDALGRRRTLIVSFFAYILSFIAYYISKNYFALLIAMVIFAMADAFRSGVHKAMIFQYLTINNWSEQKTDYYGSTRSWSQTGSAISSLLAAFFVFYYERYDIIFIASVVPYLVDMILIYTYPKYLDGEIEHISGGKIKHKFKLVINAAIESFKRADFLRILTNLTIFTGYYKSVKDYIQPLLKYVALSMPFFAYFNDERKVAVITGVIYFALYMLTALSSKYSGRFTNLFRQKSKPMNLTLILGLSIGLVTGLGYYIGMYILPIIGFVLIMITENLRKPIGIGLVADISMDESMATVLSVTSQIKSLFAAILAPIIGLIADVYNPGMGITAVSIFLLLLLPIYWLKGSRPN